MAALPRSPSAASPITSVALWLMRQSWPRPVETAPRLLPGIGSDLFMFGGCRESGPNPFRAFREGNLGSYDPLSRPWGAARVLVAFTEGAFREGTACRSSGMSSPASAATSRPRNSWPPPTKSLSEPVAGATDETAPGHFSYRLVHRDATPVGHETARWKSPRSTAAAPGLLESAVEWPLSGAYRRLVAESGYSRSTVARLLPMVLALLAEVGGIAYDRELGGRIG